MKILLVDDSSIMRGMIKRSLKAGGIEAEIDEAADGVEALAQLAGAPDIVLLDWNMPRMNGLEFMRALREKGDPTPVLMVTTETHFARQREAMAAGANGFLAKPFTPEQLAAMIRQMVTHEGAP